MTDDVMRELESDELLDEMPDASPVTPESVDAPDPKDALIADLEQRLAAAERGWDRAVTEARNWKTAAEANRDSAMGYQDRALVAERIARQAVEVLRHWNGRLTTVGLLEQLSEGANAYISEASDNVNAFLARPEVKALTANPEVEQRVTAALSYRRSVGAAEPADVVKIGGGKC